MKSGFSRRLSYLPGLRPESSQEHLPTRIAGVLRLRAIKPSIYDRSAKRFAQDDGFVGSLTKGRGRWGLEIQVVGYAEKREKIGKVTALEMTILCVWS